MGSRFVRNRIFYNFKDVLRSTEDIDKNKTVLVQDLPILIKGQRHIEVNK